MKTNNKIRISIILVLLILLNSLGVLADYSHENIKYIAINIKINGDSRFGYNKLGSGDLSFDENYGVVVSGGQIEDTNVIDGKIVFSVKDLDEYYRDRLFIPDSRKDFSSSNEAYDNYLKKEFEKNKDRKYYLDLDRIDFYYNNKFIEFLGKEGEDSIAFKLNYDEILKLEQNWVYKIDMNLTNGMVKYNPSYDELKDLENILGENDSNLEDLFPDGDILKAKLLSYDMYFTNGYGNEIDSIEIPNVDSSDEEVRKYLDKKYAVTMEKAGKNYKLIGYNLEGSNENYNKMDKMTTLSEMEYDLIRLIGLDRFIFLKSNRDLSKFKLDKIEEDKITYSRNPKADLSSFKHKDLEGYEYIYEYNPKTNKFILGYLGSQDRIETIGQEEDRLIEKILDREDIDIKKAIVERDASIEKIKLEAVDRQGKKQILTNLFKEDKGTNIIADIASGGLDKAYSDKLLNQVLDDDLEVIGKELDKLKEEIYLYKQVDNLSPKMMSFSRDSSQTDIEMYEVRKKNLDKRYEEFLERNYGGQSGDIRLILDDLIENYSLLEEGGNSIKDINQTLELILENERDIKKIFDKNYSKFKGNKLDDFKASKDKVFNLNQNEKGFFERVDYEEYGNLSEASKELLDRINKITDYLNSNIDIVNMNRFVGWDMGFVFRPIDRIYLSIIYNALDYQINEDDRNNGLKAYLNYLLDIESLVVEYEKIDSRLEAMEDKHESIDLNTERLELIGDKKTLEYLQEIQYYNEEIQDLEAILEGNLREFLEMEWLENSRYSNGKSEISDIYDKKNANSILIEGINRSIEDFNAYKEIGNQKNILYDFINLREGLVGKQVEYNSLVSIASFYGRLSSYFDQDNKVINDNFNQVEVEKNMGQIEAELAKLEAYLIEKDEYEKLLGVDDTKYKISEVMDLYSFLLEGVEKSRRDLLNEGSSQSDQNLMEKLKSIELQLDYIKKDHEYIYDYKLSEIKDLILELDSSSWNKYKPQIDRMVDFLNEIMKKETHEKKFEYIISEWSELSSSIYKEIYRELDKGKPTFTFTNSKGDTKEFETYLDAIKEMDNYIEKLKLDTLINLNIKDIQNPDYKYKDGNVDFKLIYMLSDNDGSDKNDKLEYYRLPWIEYEIIGGLEAEKYNEVKVKHIIKNSTSLTYDEKIGKYKLWMFNDNVSYNGQIEDSLKIRVPSNRKLVLDTDKIGDYFIDINGGRIIGVELDYVEINGEKIYLEEAVTKEGSLYRTNDKKIEIYTEESVKSKDLNMTQDGLSNEKLESINFAFKEFDPNYKTIRVRLRQKGNGELIDTYSYQAIRGFQHRIYPKKIFAIEENGSKVAYKYYGESSVIVVESKNDNAVEEIVDILYDQTEGSQEYDTLKENSDNIAKDEFFRGDRIKFNLVKVPYIGMITPIDRENYYIFYGIPGRQFISGLSMYIQKEDMELFDQIEGKYYGIENSIKAALDKASLEKSTSDSIQFVETMYITDEDEIYLLDNYLTHTNAVEPVNSYVDRHLTYEVNHKFFKNDQKEDKEINKLISQENRYNEEYDYWLYKKMDFIFSNLIYGNWDQYEKSVKQAGESKFEKLIVNRNIETYNLINNGEKISYSKKILENITVTHDSSLAEKELKKVGNEYFFNFSKTDKEDWESYLYESLTEDGDKVSQEGSLALNVKGNEDFDTRIYKDVNIDFEYHFSGDGDIFIPDDNKLKVDIQYIDEVSGKILEERNLEGLSKGDSIDLKTTIISINNYEYIRTSPSNERIVLEDGNLQVKHYYRSLTPQEKEKLRVSYDGNGNTDGSAPVDSKNPYEKGEEVVVLGSNDLRKTGYSFKGWSSNRYASRGEYFAGDQFIINHDRTLYAIWEKDSSGGGRDKPDPKPEPKPEPEPVKPEPSKPTDRRGREIGKIIEPKIEYELNKTDHFAYIKGYPDITVQPNGYITREEVAMVFYRLMEPEYRSEIETAEHKYSDVRNNIWSTKAIATLSNGELLLGYGDGSFKPNNNMTRAEISKVIARFTDTIVLETQMPDIIGHWAEDYINTAENKGWIKGYTDGSFKPNELLTRAEFVTMVNSLLDRKVKKENALPGLKEFKDLPEKWYYEQMIEAINGHDYKVDRLDDGTEKWIKLVDTQFPD